MSVIILDKNWSILPVKNKEDWRQAAGADVGFFEAALPGPWQRISGLEGHYGTVVYRNRFQLHLPKNHYATLVMDRACYLTRVCLNGTWVGKPQAGYFQKRYVAFENKVEKDNTLYIEVTCDREKDLTQKRQILGIFFALGYAAKKFKPWWPASFSRSSSAWASFTGGLKMPSRTMGGKDHTYCWGDRFNSVHQASTWVTFGLGASQLRW